MANINVSGNKVITICVAIGVLAALIWFVGLPIAQKSLDEAKPASSEAIKAAIGESNCMRRELERRALAGLVVSNGTLERLYLPCKINDEQVSALSK